MSVIWLQSGFDDPPEPVRTAARSGRVTILRRAELTGAALGAHRGLITGLLLDQDAMMALRPLLERFLDRGGRWVFNGHLVRPLVEGLFPYQPMRAPRRRDFDLCQQVIHPIFDGVDPKHLETNKGVAGFYGRGANPPPPGAVVLNTLGQGVAVDWVWHRPSGGAIFSHAGNDLAQIATLHGFGLHIWANLIDWADGGPCVPADAPRVTRAPDATRFSRPAEPRGAPDTSRLIGVTAGTCYHIQCFEGPRYRDIFDLVIAPERIDAVLRPDDILFVPCRTPPQRMIARRDRLAAHLAAGGTIVAMGESRSDLWLPEVAFSATETNWWWWLTPGADLGVRRADPHALLDGLRDADLTWHLHGYFHPPPRARIFVRDSAGHAIAYDDSVSTPGRMIVTSLDPCYHHGSHFMPATTRFLDRFLPNLRRLRAGTVPA
ncbi:hypothetical protein [Roseicyclus marinus]|uniref:hypothetical protein n=1 Tax=Roseicyclus marinus TaxID=2161673 RepID=UPI0024103642|nr:hypothetical protein [Roseicyclus marinus]MDG3043003.1 hypothetical protein [Roseicyclus marinus]